MAASHSIFISIKVVLMKGGFQESSGRRLEHLDTFHSHPVPCPPVLA